MPMDGFDYDSLILKLCSPIMMLIYSYSGAAVFNEDWLSLIHYYCIIRMSTGFILDNCLFCY